MSEKPIDGAHVAGEGRRKSIGKEVACASIETSVVQYIAHVLEVRNEYFCELSQPGGRTNQSGTFLVTLNMFVCRMS
jgi:hypothetical protein